jgi:ATP-binding cassette, subfamily C (CFTR/MRP), member 1
MGVYFAWGVAQGIFSLLSGVTFSFAGAKAARQLHANAIRRVIRAPTRFFDTTPLGRIINRYFKKSLTLRKCLIFEINLLIDKIFYLTYL